MKFKSTTRPTLKKLGSLVRRIGQKLPFSSKIGHTTTGILGFFLGVATLSFAAAMPLGEEGAGAPVVAATSDIPRATADPTDFASGFVDVADAVVPGVVRIETRRTAPTGGMASLPFPREFQFFFQPPGGMNAPQPRQALSGGTGFLVGDDGYILTNHHVVDDAEEITVWLHDRRSFTGELVGSDPTTDVAVLKIDGEDLPSLPTGRSDDVRVGEWILAVGNPGFRGGRPLDETVTVGIVSAVGRPLSVIRSGLSEDPDDRSIAEWAIEDFIQTDAVINPGNSGGPLVNMSGEVVGMNTAIMSTSGYYQGYGFAIPIDLALGVMDDIVEHGHIRRAWLGVRISNVTAEDAEAFDLPEISGVLVQGVTEDGPGDEAGLEIGDVIVDVDGHAIDRVGGLQQRIARSEPGARVLLTVMRDGKRRTVRVELGDAPLSAERTSQPTARAREGSELLGFEFDDVSPRLQQQFGLSRDEGVVVTGVDAWGPAARKNLTPGTAVVSANGERVKDAKELREVLEEINDGDVVSLVLEDRQGSTWIANIRARAERDGGSR